MAKTKTEVEATLIDLVRDRPCLYAKDDPNYKNTVVRESAWREIQDSLGKTVKDWQSLWTSLRQQYTKFLRKQKNPSGSGRGRKLFFRHSAAMMFIKDTVDLDNKTISNLESQDHESEELPENSDEHSIQIQVVDVNDLPPDDDASDMNSSTSQQVPRSKPIPEGRTHEKYGKKRKMDQFDTEVLELLKTEEDEYDSFCKMLAPKLRQLAKVDRRSFLRLQMNINNFVSDAELESLELN